MMRFAKNLGLAAATLCLVAGLAACGKKEMPRPPDGSTYPHQYPKPQ
jgi:hypothetical protein